jgi:hypothetical protein
MNEQKSLCAACFRRDCEMRFPAEPVVVCGKHMPAPETAAQGEGQLLGRVTAADLERAAAGETVDLGFATLTVGAATYGSAIGGLEADAMEGRRKLDALRSPLTELNERLAYRGPTVPADTADFYKDMVERLSRQLAASEAQLQEQIVKTCAALMERNDAEAKLAASEARERELVAKAKRIFGEGIEVSGSVWAGEDTGRVIATFSHEAEAENLAGLIDALASRTGGQQEG